MEVNSASKQLHKHALPVAVIVLSLLSLSALTLDRYQTTDFKRQVALGRGLITRPLQITPAANGLSKITSPRPAQLDAAGDLSEIGHGTGLTLSLQLADQ